MLLAFFAATLAFANTPTEQVVGSWSNVWPGKGKAVMSFRSDGTFSASIYFDDGKVYSKGGTWKCEKNQILYQYRDAEGNITNTDIDQILSITDDYLIIIAQDGAKRKYDKIKK